jgi:enediyne biosynthesis protein E4
MSRRVRIVGTLVVAALVIAAGAGAGAVAVFRSATLTSALGAPRFVDETSASGLAHTYGDNGGGDAQYDVGGGVAVFDCDGDRRPDVFVAGGSNPAAVFRNESATGGALRFALVANPVTDLTGVTGGYPIDVDGDGIVDLAVLKAGGMELLRGLGDCRFEPANDVWGVSPSSAFTTAFSATWEGWATLPTLAVGSYVDPESGARGAYQCEDNELIRPSPAGDRYAAATPLTPSYCALSMLFSDWDGSGRRDLRVSNDRQYYDNNVGEEQLWRFEAGQPPRLYSDADGWVPLQLWGMGIASYDVTGDGFPEVYLTSQAANTLQTLTAGPARPTFGDIALKRHIEATRPDVGGDPLPSTAWHPEFEDVNNDGLVDLFVSKGNVNEIPDFAAKDPSNLFLGQPDGSFVEGADAAGIVTFDRGRGAAMADFNQDGLLDLLEVNLDAPVRVWRNVGAGTPEAPAAMGGWLAVRLSEPGGNRDAIGSIIEVKAGDTTIRRELVIGGGHIGGQLGWTHVGLGPASEAQVRVTWPDGEVGPWLRVASDQFVDIARGAAQAVPWSPSAG